jgi:hypothetical protein
MIDVQVAEVREKMMGVCGLSFAGRSIDLPICGQEETRAADILAD